MPLDEQEICAEDPDRAVQAEAAEPQEPVFVVRLGKSLYGFLAHEVDSVALMAEPVSIPLADPVFTGVLRNRGRILPLISLPVLLDLPSNQSAPLTGARLIILDSQGELFGFLADAALGVRLVPKKRLRTEQVSFEVGEGVVTLLEADKILARVAGVSREPV